MSFQVPIGHRAFILVVSQVAISAVLALSALYGFSRMEYHHDIETIQNTRVLLLTIGVAGTSITLLINAAVLHIILPNMKRLRRMVAHIRYFQETGVHNRIGDTGTDDIAALGNGLDAGMAAIASREQERGQFLAIVAHELKTPMTAIQGYASLLETHPKDQIQVSRAIDIIYRQSARLTRLIEALLLAMRARTGKLHFEPKPFDMSALVRRVLRDMHPCLCHKTFSHCITDNISILGDQALLEHALWALFTCAAVLSSDSSPVQVAFVAQQRATLSVDIKSSGIPIPEVHELFMPFRDVQYETGEGIRSAIGLYLCREIVRVHNGQLYVHSVSELHPEFLMELPI